VGSAQQPSTVSSEDGGSKGRVGVAQPSAAIAFPHLSPTEVSAPNEKKLRAPQPQLEKPIGTQAKPTVNDCWSSSFEQKHKEVLTLQLEEKQKELQELRARLLLRARPPATASDSGNVSDLPEDFFLALPSAVWVKGAPQPRPLPPPPSFGAFGVPGASVRANADVVAATHEESDVNSPPPAPSLPTKRKLESQHFTEEALTSPSEAKASVRTLLRGSLALAAKVHTEHLDENRRNLVEPVAAQNVVAKKQHQQQPRQQVAQSAGRRANNGAILAATDLDDADEIEIGEVRIIAAVRDGVPLTAEEVRSGMIAAAKASGTLQPSRAKRRRKHLEAVAVASTVVQVLESDDDGEGIGPDEADYT